MFERYVGRCNRLIKMREREKGPDSSIAYLDVEICYGDMDGLKWPLEFSGSISLHRNRSP